MRSRASTPSSDAKRAAGAAGFSLLELLVVLVLVALSVGMVGPRLFGRAPAGLVALAVAQVQHAVERAQLSAVSRGRPVVMAFDAERRLILLDGAAADRPWPAGVSIAAEPARLRFEPDYGGSGGRIRVETDGVRQWITIDRLTGRAWLSREGAG